MKWTGTTPGSIDERTKRPMIDPAVVIGG